MLVDKVSPIDDYSHTTKSTHKEQRKVSSIWKLLFMSEDPFRLDLNVTKASVSRYGNLACISNHCI